MHDEGIAQSVLDTGKVYDDVLTDTHLEYHYPTTSQKTTDNGEINSLKTAAKYNVPIFIVLGLEKDSSKKIPQKNSNLMKNMCIFHYNLNLNAHF